MRVLSRRVGAAALFLAVLLAGRGSLAAESEVGPGTFRLFPPGMVPNPLLSPDPDPDPERSLLDTAVFLSEPDDPPVEEVRLDLHLPDAVLAVHAPPPTISLPVTRRSGLTGSLKTLTTGAIFAATIGFSAGNSLKETSYPGPTTSPQRVSSGSTPTPEGWTRWPTSWITRSPRGHWRAPSGEPATPTISLAGWPSAERSPGG